MKVNHLRLALLFAILFVFGIAVGFFGFPALLRTMIRKQVVLTPGTDTREKWTSLPFPIRFSIYVFNITNPDEISQGSKPIVNEIGPFVFDEWKDKYNLEDNEDDDTVTFNMRNTFFFRPDKSNGLTGEEIITMPHPIIQSISLVVKREREPMLPLIVNGLKEIFPDTNAFIRAKFIELFYHGFLIDCSSDNFAAKAICLQFNVGEIKGSSQYNSTHFLFSFLGSSNGTNAGKFTVYRGKNNSEDIGRIVKFNDEIELNVWSTEVSNKCNEFYGTDSTIFPPLLNTSSGLWSFTSNLCRSMTPQFQRESSYDGIPTNRYTMDFGDLTNEEENHCFCDSPPNNCPLKGTMNLQKCTGAPMIASLPHFLYGDLSLLANIDGLSPNLSKHEIFVEFESMSGTPMSVAKRLQFSLDIESVELIDSMKNFNKMIMPLFWIEESFNLNKTFVDILKKKIFLGIQINDGLKWFCTIFGLFGFVICSAIYLRQKFRRTNIVDK